MLHIIEDTVFVGIIAGLLSGMVKIGWEAILPPRSQARDETNPPQQLLQQLGFSKSFTHAYWTYATDQRIYFVALFMHFGFSITFAALFTFLQAFNHVVAIGQGTVYGIVVWFIFHIVLLPLLKTIPSPAKQPFAEHFSEFFGHMVWGWSIYLVMVALIG